MPRHLPLILAILGVLLTVQIYITAPARAQALPEETQRAIESVIQERTTAAERAAEAHSQGAISGTGQEADQGQTAEQQPPPDATVATDPTPAPTANPASEGQASPPQASPPQAGTAAADLVAVLRDPEARTALIELLRATAPATSPTPTQAHGETTGAPASTGPTPIPGPAGLAAVAASALASGGSQDGGAAGSGEGATPNAEASAQDEGDSSALSIPAPDITALTSLFHDLYENVVWTSGITTQIPEIWEWMVRQVDDDRRGVWLHLSWQIALVVAAGLLAALLTRLAIRGAVRQLQEKAGETSETRRLILLITRLVLTLLPISVFAVAAQAMMPVIDATWRTEVVAAAVITSLVILRAIDLVLHALLSPSNATLRLLPTADPTARLLFRGLRCIALALVLGYLLVEVARLLGMPPGGRTLLVHLVGLSVLVLTVHTLIALRAVGKTAIRRITFSAGATSAWITGLQRGLADIWHILATAYAIGIFFAWVIDTEQWFKLAGWATLRTMLVVFVGVLLFGWIQKTRDAAVMRMHGATDLDRAARARGRRYIAAGASVARLIVASLALVMIIDAWHIDAVAWMTQGGGQRLTAMAFNLLLVLGISVALWEGVNHLIQRYLSGTDAQGNLVERGQRERTLLPLLRNVLTVFLVVVASLIVLSEIGVDIAPLLAGAGVIGLAIGFGSQRLVQDVISGVFNLLEDTIGVGDVVQVGSHAGVVEAMSIRSIRLRDLSGNLHTIPFSGVDTVTNMTKDFSYYLLDVGVAYRENTDRVVEVLREIGADLQDDEEYGPCILEPLEVLGVDGFHDSAVIIKARIKTPPIKQWWVGREFNRRMKLRFDALGIEIPYPHMTLYFGADKDGNAPPAHLNVDRLAGIDQGLAPAGRPSVVDERTGPTQPASTVSLPDPDGDSPGDAR